MKSSIWQASHLGLTGRKVAVTLVFASLISGLSISPAMAENDHGRGQGNRHGQNAEHEHHGHHQRRSRGDREGRYQPQYRRPYYYNEPVYVPPTVYYERQQSPGISLFFPLDLRRSGRTVRIRKSKACWRQLAFDILCDLGV